MSLQVHIIAAFPESIAPYFEFSIFKKAQEKKLITLHYYKLANFSNKKTKRFDDKAYGMHGQVLCPEPFFQAIEMIYKTAGKKLPTIYMSPRGKLLEQKDIPLYHETLGNEFVILCGHYEGIDERVIETFVDISISLGNYILTSGELACAVFLDAFIRYIPGVIHNPKSIEEESFSPLLEEKKEYPVYTRPRIFQGKSVPEVLYSGNHKKIEEWKKKHLL